MVFLQKRKSNKHDDNEVCGKSAINLIFDSYNVLFCRSCKVYDCTTHNHSYESLDFWQKFALENEKRSSQKAINVNPANRILGLKVDALMQKAWPARYKVIARKIISVCRGNMCRAVNVVGHRDWDELTHSASYRNMAWKNLILQLQTTRKYENQRGRQKKKIRRRKISNTLYSEMKRNNNDVANRFLPCAHDGICTKKSCLCSRNGHFCLKQCMLFTFSLSMTTIWRILHPYIYIEREISNVPSPLQLNITNMFYLIYKGACPADCPNKFPGCNCSKTCQSGQCPCYASGRGATLTYVEAVELTSRLFLLETRVVHVVIHR